MIEYLKKEWIKLLIQVVMAFIAAVFAFQFMLKRDSKSYITDSIDKKADKEYVDQQDQSIRTYVDKQDDNTKSFIQQHAAETKETNQIMIEYMKSINGKLEVLMGRQK